MVYLRNSAIQRLNNQGLEIISHRLPSDLGGTPLLLKVLGVLVVSLRGVNCKFWSHLGCLGLKVILFSHSGIAGGCALRNLQKIAWCLFSYGLL